MGGRVIDMGAKYGLRPAASMVASASSMTEGLWVDAMSPGLMPVASVVVSAMSMTEGLSWADVAMSPRLMPAAIVVVSASSMTEGYGRMQQCPPDQCQL